MATAPSDPSWRSNGRAAGPWHAPKTGRPATAPPAVSQQARGAGSAYARRSRQLVRRVAAKRNEIRHLFRIDTIAHAHLRRTDARHFTRAYRVENGRVLGSKLKRVAVAARNKHRPAAP